MKRLGVISVLLLATRAPLSSVAGDIVPEGGRVSGTGSYQVKAICTHGQPGLHGEYDRIEREAVVDGKRYTVTAMHSARLVPSLRKATMAGTIRNGRLVLDSAEDVTEAASPPAPAFAPLPAYSMGATGLGGLVFDPSNPPTNSVPPTVAYNEYNGSYSHQYGPKTLYVFLVRPTDGAAWTNAPTVATLSNQLNTASQWYYDTSYRLTWFGPKIRFAGTAGEVLVPRLVIITNVINLAHDSTYYMDSPGTIAMEAQSVVQSWGGEYTSYGPLDPANADRVVVMSNKKMINSTGLAYVGGDVAWVGTDLSGSVAIHEWGHNWGVVHANFWDPVATGIARSPANTHVEYGDGADVMGGGSGEFNPLFQEELGFLQSSLGEIVAVTNAGVYRLYDHADPWSRNPVSCLRSLVVPITGTGSYQKRLFLGLRHGTGTDGGTARGDWNRNAIEIHSDYTSDSGANDGSHFLDTTPWSRQTNDKDDGAVKVGRTYSEGLAVNGTNIYGGLHITPLARGSVTTNGHTHEYVDVRINYGMAPGNHPPSMTVAAAPAVTSVNAAVTLTASASDPDGDPVAYDWFFGDGQYSLTNSAVQAHSWSTSGFYRVTCAASDMRGGIASNAVWVNVGNLPYRAADIPAATVPGLDYRYYEGTFSTLPVFDALLPVEDGPVTNFSLSPRKQNDTFLFAYDGYLDVPTQDVYTFTVSCDDGAKLYIGDTAVVNNDGTKSSALEASGNIALQAGKHRIRLEFFHKDGAESLGVYWSTLSMNRTPIPSANLFRTDWGTNAPPTVAIMQPVAGMECVVNSDVMLQASADDADGIAKVQYFTGGSLIGESTNAPYLVTWSRPSAGSKTVIAIARDRTGRWSESVPVSFAVVSPAPRASFAMSFDSKATSGATMNYSDVCGAVYPQANWNNLGGLSGSTTQLVDMLGFACGASAAWTCSANSSYIVGYCNADTSTGPGRMFKGCLETRQDEAPRKPSVTVNNIPFTQYDVYVYFDLLGTDARDTTAQQFIMAPSSGPVPKPLFGQNSLSYSDAPGDYPNYDTWIGFREATATNRNDSQDRRLGNYVVFRDLTASAFTIIADFGNPSTTQRLGFNGLQVVEAASTVAGVRIRQTGGGTAVAEGGASDTYAVSLAVAPSNDVTVMAVPGSQLAVDPAILTFTSNNWQVAQMVTVSAVDDTVPELSPHVAVISNTVFGGGNYAGVTVAPLAVAITDNDQPVVSVSAAGQPGEGVVATGRFQIVRSGVASMDSPLTVAFRMGGTAASNGTDYTLGGETVSVTGGVGTGTVTIAAGQAQAFVTLVAVDDAAAEGSETAVMTLLPGPNFTFGSSTTAVLAISDNDTVDYYCQKFSSGQLETTFDLSNRKLTLTPNGSPSGYATSVTTTNAFPSSTTGHAAISSRAVTSGSSDDGYWTTNLPSVFYGVTNNTLHIGSNGYITFDSGDTTTSASLTNTSHFAQRRIAGFFRDLNPGAGGTIYAGRVTTAGQQRTVITYTNVPNYSGGGSMSFQAELWDSGLLTLTWLSCTGADVVVGLSNQSGTMPSPFFESNLSDYGAPGTSNAAPQFASLPVLAATSGVAYAYAIACADPDGQSLAISSAAKPGWLVLSDQGDGTASLTGTAVTGTYDVTLAVSDGTAGATQTFRVVVCPATGNQAPLFTNTPTTRVNAGSAYSAVLGAADPDGHRLAFSTLALPSWLSLTDQGNGMALLTGTAPITGLSSFPVIVSVSDGFVATVQSFAITVNQLPVITMRYPLEDAVVLPDRTDTLHLEARASDDGMGSLTGCWTQVAGPASAPLGEAAAPSSTVTFTQSGRYEFDYTAGDGQASASRRIRVFVETDPDASILSDHLQGYWRFDEGTGTTVADSSTNGRTMTLTNATMVSDGVSGKALACDISGKKYGEATYTFPTQLTVAVWARTDVSPAAGDRYLIHFCDGGGNVRWRVYHASGSRRLRIFSDRTTDGIWQIEQDIPADTWFHLAVIYDGSAASNAPLAYLDGKAVPVGVIQSASGAQGASTLFRVGGHSANASQSWPGHIDEVRVFNRVVATNDIPLALLAHAVNRAPTVDAGADRDIAGAQALALTGAAADDGIPASPGALTTAWSWESGPVEPVIADAGALTSLVTFASRAGTHVMRLIAEDGAACVSTTVRINVTSIGSPYQNWAQEQGLTGSNAVELADPDGDGLPNLAEYAFGTVPDNVASRAYPQPVTVNDGANRVVCISYRERRGGVGTVGVDYTAGGVRYTVETTDDLSAQVWPSGTGAVVAVGLPTDNGDGTETVAVRRRVSGIGTNGFLRVVLTESGE